MLRPLLALALALAAGACASDPRLPVCDGRHQRPANPQGSVLLSADPPQSLDLGFKPCGDQA